EVDDAPALLRDHRLERLARAEERRVEMRREHLMPIVVAKVLRASRDRIGLANPPDTGIVDENIDGAVRRDEIREHLFYRRAIRDIGHERLRALAAGTLDLGHHVLRRFGPDVVDTDLGPLARESQSGLAPQPGATAGYQHYFVLKFHAPLMTSVSLPSVAAS